MGICACGVELGDRETDGGLCPACLLRLALEPSAITVDDSPATPARLLGPVGRGPHGTVHLAIRPDDDPQIVTVKVIDVPTDTGRFCERVRDTAEALGTLRRAGVAELLQAGVTANGRAYVVAAYIVGPSLGDYVGSHRRDTSDRVQLAGRLCALVADLHLHGIIHGSIKPTNVIVIESADGPFPVLLDVGIVPAIELAGGNRSAATPLRDEQGLHAVLANVLGDLGSLVAGTESAAALAEIFARPAN
jgi:serine/threonine protein kinase